MDDIAFLRTWLARADSDPLFRYFYSTPQFGGMSPGQERFHRSDSRYRRLQAGNQIGKTRAGAAETWAIGLNRHPWRPKLRDGQEGWIVIPDLEGDWPKISKKLHEVQPPDALDPSCKYDSVRGYMVKSARGILMSNGTVVRCKSGSQHVGAVEGGTVDWIWIDEPPKREHWYALLQRVSVRGGLVWLTFTPIGRPLGWLKEYFEGNPESNPVVPPAEGWEEIRIRLSAENAPHRSPESIADQLAAMAWYERKQRADGDWEGITEGRRLVAFGEGLVWSDTQIAATRIDSIRIGIDHGEVAGRQAIYLIFVFGQKLIVADEAISATASTPREDARALIAMLARWGLTVAHVSLAYGDTNSAGKAGMGSTANELLMAAIAEELRIATGYPLEILRPYKGPGSVLAREKGMNSAMAEGRFFVGERCKAFINACNHYTGEEKDLKHPLDAVGYATYDLLTARFTPPKPKERTIVI